MAWILNTNQGDVWIGVLFKFHCGLCGKFWQTFRWIVCYMYRPTQRSRPNFVREREYGVEEWGERCGDFEEKTRTLITHHFFDLASGIDKIIKKANLWKRETMARWRRANNGGRSVSGQCFYGFLSQFGADDFLAQVLPREPYTSFCPVSAFHVFWGSSRVTNICLERVRYASMVSAIMASLDIQLQTGRWHFDKKNKVVRR